MFLLQILSPSGQMTGKTFQVSGRTAMVGRAKSNDIQLTDPAMSRTHLKIMARDSGWVIQDLWSRNGTLLNGTPLEAGQERLARQGDRITIGMTSFCLSAPEYSDDQETIHTDMDENLSALGSPKSMYEDRPGTYVRNVELIYGLSRSLMGSLHLSDIFQRLTDYLFDLFKRIDRVGIFQKDPETGRLEELLVQARGGIPPDAVGYSRTIVDSVFRSGEPQLFLEFHEQDKSQLSDSQQPILSYMCVPLISRSEVQGVIYVDSLKSACSFRQEDLLLLSALSSPAAMAIENATLLANLEEMVDVKTHALQEVGDQLRQSEIRYKAVFNNMKRGAMVLRETEGGGDFRILELNEAALRMEGWGKKERFLGKRVSEVFPFAESSGLMKSFHHVRQSGMAKSIVITISRGSNVHSYWDCYLYRLATVEVVMLYEDITEKRMREKEQKELQIQLYNSQKLESIGLIAGGVAHSFRNILQAISGNTEYLELIYRGQPKIHEIAGAISDSVKKGAELIQDLLHFSRRSQDGDFNDFVDLREVIETTCNIISRLVDRKITIEKRLEAGLMVKGNASFLRQVFMNLLTNARDAISGKGRILVEATVENAQVVCRVSDTGAGMDSNTIERIFDPFFTLNEVGQGIGLGLSTSRGIIGQHGGCITATSTLGRGSTFEITLPLADAEE